MATWKQILPDYEFIKWDFTRFDASKSDWVREAFDNKKYAFAADYIRMYALYTMGGIYMDMDVEVLKSFNDLLHLKYFLCFENSGGHVLEVATFGVEKNCPWVGDVLDYYKDRHFIKPDGTFETKPLPRVTREVLLSKGYTFEEVESLSQIDNNVKDDSKKISVLPFDWFSPKSYSTSKVNITPNTHSVHRFASSWIPWEQRMERKLWLALGLKPHRVMWHFDKWLNKVFHIKR